MKSSFKLKANAYHIAGAVLLAIGLGVMIFGLVRLYKIDHRRDVSELTEGDIKYGTYVSGTITSQGELLRGYPMGSETADSPVIIKELSSSDTARRSLLLTDLVHQTGKYISADVDEYYYTYLYHFISSGQFADSGVDEVFQFDGVIIKKKSYVQAMKDMMASWNENWLGLYSGSKMVNAPQEASTWEYTIKLIDIGPRRFTWLYSIPFLFCGVMVFAIGGKPMKRVR